MAQIVNLSRIRKQRKRAADRAEADANAARFGRTRAEREAERRAAEKAARDLDAHLRSREDEAP